MLRRGRAERELSREVAAHLALIEDDFRARGMSVAEARLAARRAYGGVEQSKELHRDARSFVWMEQAFQDLRHALRGLRKSPGFCAVALLSLACGIGVNTAIFTLVHGILLERLPVPDPERVVQVKAHFKEFDGAGFSYPVFTELRRQDAVFADVIGFERAPAVLTDGDARRPIRIENVTGTYFAFFGVRPALGRWIDAEDDRVEGARPVCVISHELWQTRFGGDPQVLGRTLQVSAASLQVIGVAPPGFRGADMQRSNDLWAPTAMMPEIFRRGRRDTPTWVWLSVLARLKPGVSFAEASSRLEAATAGIEAALPQNRANRNPVYRIVDASRGFDSWRTVLREPLILLMGAVTLVLLVACANLANLLLARAGERRQEFAIKLSLGISRWRLLRQLLFETFALTFAGGALGVVLAVFLTRYLLAVFNSGSRFQNLTVTPDATVLLYTLAGCLVTALIAGLYPAWHAARTDVARRLVAAAQARRAVTRRALILVQVTLAAVLLYGATLFTHSLRNLESIPLGFDIDRVLSVGIRDNTPGKQRNSVKGSPELAEVLARVRQLPGVEGAGYAHPGPLMAQSMSSDAEIVDSAGRKRTFDISIMFASPGFLSTMKIPLLRGRDFTPADRDGAPGVLLVNERLASMIWPGENPIGKRLDGWSLKNAEIVGVVGNSHYRGVREKPLSIVYEPFDQEAVDGGVLQIRYRGSLAAVEREVRQIVRQAAPRYVVAEASPMTLMRDGDIGQDRLLAFLSSIFGALGTGLALVGIYGLIAYSVTRRTREVGIRVSVGAQRRDVLWLFLRESIALLAAGVAIGLPLAILLARLARKMLYQVSPTDPGDLAITLACLGLGGLLAAYIPARRSTRIDPVRALRHD
jgi:predicted permease